MSTNQKGKRTGLEENDYLNEWREVPLASVADIRFSSVNKVAQPGEEPVRLCNYTDVYNNDYIKADMDFMRATSTRSEIERFGLQIGDVIITKDSETPDDIGIPLLRPNQEEVDPTFLAKQLAHYRLARYFGRQANGTTRYGLSTDSIANAPLYLPRPEDQRCASLLMRMVDMHIAQTEAVMAKLKQVRTGMLHDLLSYGLDENGQIRDPIAHPEQFKESRLGWIPRDWNECYLGQWAIFQPGYAFKNHELSNSGWQVVRISNLHKEDFPFWHYSGPIRDSWIVNNGDLLFSWAGVASSIDAYIYRGSKALLNQHIYNLKIDSDSERYFVYHCLCRLLPKLRLYIEGGAGQLHLSKDKIEKILLPKPPSQELCNILTVIEAHEANRNQETNILLKLEKIKAGLQDDLLTGRVRVPETIIEGAGRK
jgi:type I restriction enzyme S subunit